MTGEHRRQLVIQRRTVNVTQVKFKTVVGAADPYPSSLQIWEALAGFQRLQVLRYVGRNLNHVSPNVNRLMQPSARP